MVPKLAGLLDLGQFAPPVICGKRCAVAFQNLNDPGTHIVTIKADSVAEIIAPFCPCARLFGRERKLQRMLPRRAAERRGLLQLARSENPD